MKAYEIEHYRKLQADETKAFRAAKAKLLSDWRKGGTCCFIGRRSLVETPDGVGRVVRVEKHYETWRFGVRLRDLNMKLSPITRWYHESEIGENYSR